MKLMAIINQADYRPRPDKLTLLMVKSLSNIINAELRFPVPIRKIRFKLKNDVKIYHTIEPYPSINAFFSCRDRRNYDFAEFSNKE